MTTPPRGPTILHLRNDLAEIGTLAEALEQFGETHQVSPAIINVVNLALEEIITNIISYGFADTGAHTIRVELGCENGSLSAIVEDDGEEFDPLSKRHSRIGASAGSASIWCGR
jgi:serine/threonine-protein kinase RsbW